MKEFAETGLEAHGGKLVDRWVKESAREEFARATEGLQRLQLDLRQQSDLEMLAGGGYSPLKGFMGRADHSSVVESMELSEGTLWPLPVTLSVSREIAAGFKTGEKVALEDQTGKLLGQLSLEEKFEIDKTRRAEQIFGTADQQHPGVEKTVNMGEVCLGGEILALLDTQADFQEYRLTPAQTRKYFQKQGWRTVVGFQTRNPVHRAHEYLLKCALELVDGLLLHPLVGETKSDDVPARVRMDCYRTVLKHYFPEERVLLSVMPAKMNYAGPREAVLHALIRKNYGCTHFIVGRDHAGVGNYYGTYEAQRIFDDIPEADLGIKPLFFEYAFWCEVCGNIASQKTCPHGAEDQIYLSGTKVRQIVEDGGELPEEFSRPEVAEILKRAYDR